MYTEPGQGLISQEPSKSRLGKMPNPREEDNNEKGLLLLSREKLCKSYHIFMAEESGHFRKETSDEA